MGLPPGRKRVEVFHVDNASTPISSWTGSGEYTLQTSDVGEQIRFEVSFVDDDGFSESISFQSYLSRYCLQVILIRI